MKTERVFLMELFLDDELPKNIRLKIKDRFQEMEEQPLVATRANGRNPDGGVFLPAPMNQAPSMQRIMADNQDLIPKPPVPVTPAAAQALAARQALLNSAGKEKPEEGRRSPRKA